VSRTVETDDQGAFRAADLPPAVYAIAVEANGFRSASRAAIAVNVDTTTRVDVTLSLATVAETVDVAGFVTGVETTTGDLGTVLDQARVDRLPLNRRDFLQLSMLVAGV